MSSPSPGKRRMDTDVIKLIESKHEVTILGGLNEFVVKFFGPSGNLHHRLEENSEIVVGHMTKTLILEPQETSLYEGGVWKVRVDLPDKYPFKSPSIGINKSLPEIRDIYAKRKTERFLNKIYHPNIDEASGTVCLDVINQAWTALYDLSNIFESFLPQLLAYPNPVDPLNGDAAALYLHKPEQYKDRIKDYIKKYATEEALKEQDEMSSSSEESSISDFSEDEAQDMEL